MQGTASRLVLLYRPAGCDTFGEWVRQNPVSAKLFRRLVMLEAGSVSRKLRLKFLDPSMQIFGLGDPRRQAEHPLIARTFYSRPSCCKRTGFGQELQDHFSIESVLTVVWMRFFAATAWLFRLSIAAVEKTHARHNRLADPQMPWHVFAAAAVNAERREQLLERQRSHTNVTTWAVPPQEPAKEEEKGQKAKRTKKEGVKRAQRPVDVFRIDWIQQQKSIQPDSTGHASKWV
jgi:hypothetical protein